MSRVAHSPPSYLYIAAKATGGRTLGVRRAAGPRQLAAQLRRERLVPLRSWALPNWASIEAGAMGLKDQAELNTQLAQLLTRGVPLVEALDVTASVVGAANRPVLSRMRDLVASGTSFADACATVGVFDRVTIAVYRAAERTGDLGGAAKQLATTARRTLQVRGKAGTLMVYPAIIMSISTAVVLVVLTVIVPQIVKAFEGSGIELPWFTKMIVAAGVGLRNNAFFALMFVLGLVTGGVFMRKQLGAIVARLSRRIPYIREVVLAQESARFFTVMASMTKSGVVLADALGVGIGAIGHPLLRRQLQTMQVKLIEGGILRQLIDGVTVLPLATRRLLIAAERSGDLTDAFDTLSEDMAGEVERRSARLLAAMEPLLTVIMFVVIGGLVMALMWPMIRLASGVG